MTYFSCANGCCCTFISMSSVIMIHLIHAFNCAWSSFVWCTWKVWSALRESSSHLCLDLLLCFFLAFQMLCAHTCNSIIYEQVWITNQLFISVVPSPVPWPGSLVSTMFQSAALYIHVFYSCWNLCTCISHFWILLKADCWRERSSCNHHLISFRFSDKSFIRQQQSSCCAINIQW